MPQSSSKIFDDCPYPPQSFTLDVPATLTQPLQTFADNLMIYQKRPLFNFSALHVVGLDVAKQKLSA